MAKRARRSRQRTHVLAWVFAFVLGLVAPLEAFAVAPNGPCIDGSTQNLNAGAGIAHASVGAEARIESISPLLCTGADAIHGSFTWVGVEIPLSNGAIVQMGVGKCHDNSNLPMCDGTYRMFYAWGRDVNQGSCTSTRSPVPASLGPAPSGTHRYTVVRTSTQVLFQLDGLTQHSTSISGVSCWNGNTAAYVTETWDHGDQAGGTVGDRQTVSSALYEATVGGVWSSPGFPSCNIMTPITSYDCLRNAGNSVDIWTDRS